uniref:SFRICE_024008 n=1 Tax=Spodoptera frugiperda TaxID=7108 RepID=A0A2H1WKH6_SPOFR
MADKITGTQNLRENKSSKWDRGLLCVGSDRIYVLSTGFYQPLVVWCIINSLRIPHWDKVICNGDDDRGVSLLPYYTGHNFRSVLLLRHFRKSNKSPVIICPTLESNPRPLVSGSRIWSPLCQRGSPPTSKSSFCRFYFFGELGGVTISTRWLIVVGCVELKIELSGVPLERRMSSRGQEQDDGDEQSNLSTSLLLYVLNICISAVYVVLHCVQDKADIKLSNYTLPDPGIEPETPCPAVATTRPMR